jgi:membrane protein YqaA with SNARE-associated domain
MEHEKALDNEGPIAKLYVKILDSCESKIAPYVLGVLSFTESCCFIIPPEVLMLPMAYANRAKAFLYSTIATITSVLGAIAGYYMGMLLWTEMQPYAFHYIPGFAKYFEHVGTLYQDNAVGALLLAAFTPIPFKVFTVAAGVYSAKISLFTLIWTAILGRGVRYSLLTGIVYVLGDRAQEWIEKHFKTFTIIVMFLGIAAIAFLKLRH